MTALKLRKEIPIKRLTLVAISGIFVTLVVSLLLNNYDDSNSIADSRSLTPWGAVGGCGAGGGGGGGASVDWMGQGVSGGYVDFQIMPSFSAAPKVAGSSISENQTISLPITATFHLRPFTLGLTIPFKSVNTSLAPGAVSTTGIGDVSLSLTKSIGSEGQLSFTGGITYPTGRHDIWLDSDNSAKLLDGGAQMGPGILSASLSIGLTKDKDWGLMVFGVDYSAGLFYKKGVEFTWEEFAVHQTTDKYGFAYAREGQDAFTYRNEYNSISSDNLGLKYIAAIKQKHLHHSLQAKLSFSLNANGSASTFIFTSLPDANGPTSWDEAQTYIDEEYDALSDEEKELQIRPWIVGEVEDDDGSKTWHIINEEQRYPFKAWPSLTLGYGMEIFNEITPFFWGVSVPIKIDLDNKIGVSGFAIQAGIKFIAF